MIERHMLGISGGRYYAEFTYLHILACLVFSSPFIYELLMPSLP